MISKTFALLFASVALCSCGADTEEGVDDKLQDSQTHWLSSCDSDVQCGDLECSCGVCVATCANDASCGEFGSSMECKSGDSVAVSALCGDGYTESLCLAGCDNDDACDQGQRCVAGSCVVPTENAEAPSASESEGPTPTPPGAGGESPGPSGPQSGGAANEPGNGGSSTLPGSGGSSTLPGSAGTNSGTAGVPGSTGGSASGTGGAAPSNGGATSAGGSAGGDEYALPLNGDQVEVPESYTACTTDTDCILVGDSCSGCCTLSAINSELEQTFTDNLALACVDYEGGICDCELPALAPSCVESRCEAVPTEANDCMAVDYQDLGDFARTDCPIAETDVCREGDDGADVFTQACTLPWGPEAACPQWSTSTEAMLVLTPFSIGCEPSLQVEQVLECGDRIEVAFTSYGPCNVCDGLQLKYRALELRTSDKPVVVTQTAVDPASCEMTPEFEEQQRRILCEGTEGTWQVSSCGDYQCGAPPACLAIIPGCDCGAGRNFGAEGCVEDAMCLEQ